MISRANCTYAFVLCGSVVFLCVIFAITSAVSVLGSSFTFTTSVASTFFVVLLMAMTMRQASSMRITIFTKLSTKEQNLFFDFDTITIAKNKIKYSTPRSS